MFSAHIDSNERWFKDLVEGNEITKEKFIEQLDKYIYEGDDYYSLERLNGYKKQADEGRDALAKLKTRLSKLSKEDYNEYISTSEKENEAALQKFIKNNENYVGLVDWLKEIPSLKKVYVERFYSKDNSFEPKYTPHDTDKTYNEWVKNRIQTVKLMSKWYEKTMVIYLRYIEEIEQFHKEYEEEKKKFLGN